MASHRFWNHEKTKHYYTLLHCMRKNGIDVKFFCPAVLHSHASSSFRFSFLYECEWYGDTYYNQSASVILDAVVFIGLIPCIIYSIHSTVIHLWNIASVVYWMWLKGTMNKKNLGNHTIAAIYVNIPKRRINFSHIQSRNGYWFSELSLKHWR